MTDEKWKKEQNLNFGWAQGANLSFPVSGCCANESTGWSYRHMFKRIEVTCRACGFVRDYDFKRVKARVERERNAPEPKTTNLVARDFSGLPKANPND